MNINKSLKEKPTTAFLIYLFVTSLFPDSIGCPRKDGDPTRCD